MSYQVAKLIARIAENLPEMSSDIMQGWIENPKALQKLLLGLCPTDIFIPELKVFKTIELGTGLKTADAFRRSLKDNGIVIDEHADDILGKPGFTVATEETEIDLVVVSAAELGFKDATTLEQIYTRAKKLGLNLCPAEVGPQLCLQHKDQPNRELLIAMEPIIGLTDYLSLFKLVRSAFTLCLCCYSASPACSWTPSSRFVFYFRK